MRASRYWTLAALFALLSPSGLSHEDNPCSHLAESAERLACYDEHFAAQQGAPEDPVSAFGSE